MFSTEYDNKDLYITLSDGLDLPHTLDCGQAFRWEQTETGRWRGVAFGRLLELESLPDGRIVLYNTTKADFEAIWRHYFDLDRDYGEVTAAIAQDKTLARAAEFSHGIRVLNQEPWETLCSFILSQNNNIKRIKGIITRLCEQFGEKRDGFYTFPTARRLAALTLEDLSVLRSGFRAKYILDAAQKVSSGEIALEELRQIPTDEARQELMKIYGVGAKVADCVLLFALEHTDAFPQDVWIKRAMDVLFGGRLPECAAPYAGIVQQYIFFYARGTKLGADEANTAL